MSSSGAFVSRMVSNFSALCPGDFQCRLFYMVVGRFYDWLDRIVRARCLISATFCAWQVMNEVITNHVMTSPWVNFVIVLTARVTGLRFPNFFVLTACGSGPRHPYFFARHIVLVVAERLALLCPTLRDVPIFRLDKIECDPNGCRS